jgi:hypothetical protein
VKQQIERAIQARHGKLSDVRYWPKADIPIADTGAAPIVR